jgi:hypothetical protein
MAVLVALCIAIIVLCAWYIADYKE